MSEMKELNESLLKMRDMIRGLEFGPERDRLQGRFDLMIDRIARVPDRVMAEFDARGFKTGCPELAAIWVSEMNWALSAWELDS